MSIKLSLHIGLRYVRAKRKNQFISFISLFSMIAMALGTMALIIVLSVMNGFDGEIKRRILSVVPHGFVEGKYAIEDWQPLIPQLQKQPAVLAVSPYADSFAMLGYQGRIQSVELQGVVPELVSQVTEIDGLVTRGTLQSLSPREFNIVLGGVLAEQLGVSLGDKVVATLPELSITPAGVFPRVKRFTVSGIFYSGAQMDQRLALIHIKDAQILLRLGESIEGYQLKLTDPYHASELMSEIADTLDEGLGVKDWSQTQGGLFQAVKMEKRLVSLLLMVIIMVAALNIVTSLVLMVADKRKDIAVLRTLGMKSSHIMAIFVAQGSFVGIIGVVFGVVLGCLLALNISDLIAYFESLFNSAVFDPNTYYITTIPSTLLWQDVLIITSSAVIMSIVASLYPAYRAAQIAPAEVLRYE